MLHFITYQNCPETHGKPVGPEGVLEKIKFNFQNHEGIKFFKLYQKDQQTVFRSKLWIFITKKFSMKMPAKLQEKLPENVKLF